MLVKNLTIYTSEVNVVLVRPKVFRLGAEEADAEVFEKNLSQVCKNLYAFQLTNNTDDLKLNKWTEGKLSESTLIPLSESYSMRTRVIMATILDPACRHYLRLGIADTISNYLERRGHPIDTVIASNSSFLGVSLAIRCKRRISRSVNFEPIHYLQENYYSLKMPLVFLTKIWSTALERITCQILAISPKDSARYRYFPSFNSMYILPLQHLQELKKTEHKEFGSPLKVGFLGSTYNVKHNLEGLVFVVNGVAKEMQDSNLHFNIYGVKSPKLNFPSNVTIHGWIEPISRIYEDNDVFVVPYVGGTGQQSKMFEPLCKGKLVVANPNALAGYPFLPNLHYLSAISEADFIEKLSQCTLIPSDFRYIGKNAGKKCAQIFSSAYNLKTIKNSIFSS